MSKKDLIMKAKAKLNSSRSKQEVFDELVAELDEKPLALANFLRFMPSKAVQDKYRILQIAALVLTLSLLLTQVLHYQAGHYQNITTLWVVIRSAIAFFIVVGIASYGVRVFLFVAVVAFMHAFRVITIVGFDYLTTLHLVDIVICTLLVVIGVFLRIKLESKYKEELVQEKDEDGTIRKVSKIIFEENKSTRNDILD